MSIDGGISGAVIVQNHGRPFRCLRMEKDASDHPAAVEDDVIVFVSQKTFELEKVGAWSPAAWLAKCSRQKYGALHGSLRRQCLLQPLESSPSIFITAWHPVRSLVWKCALVFVSLRCRFFLRSQGKDRDPRDRREVRFRNILNLACHTGRSRMLWLMWSKRKQGPREAAIRRA